jgi:hypothetical protein
VKRKRRLRSHQAVNQGPSVKTPRRTSAAHTLRSSCFSRKGRRSPIVPPAVPARAMPPPGPQLANNRNGVALLERGGEAATRGMNRNTGNISCYSPCRGDISAPRLFYENFIIYSITLSLVLTNLDLSFNGAYHSSSNSNTKTNRICRSRHKR